MGAGQPRAGSRRPSRRCGMMRAISKAVLVDLRNEANFPYRLCAAFSNGGHQAME